jgi:DNA-binding protein HU-beta
MNKTELIEAMADSADISKAAAARAMDGMIEAITKAMQNGDTVSILGFGTFTVRARAARTGRTPRPESRWRSPRPARPRSRLEKRSRMP